MSRRRTVLARAAAWVVLGVTAVGCSASPPPAAEPVSAASATATATPTSAGSSPVRSASPTRTPSATPTATASSKPTASAKAVAAPPSLRGDRGNAWAFAPLDDPGQVTVEGRPRSGPAWSTSKVLVVAAYLDTRVDGDPRRLTKANKRLIARALQESDADAVLTLRNRITGSPGRAMTSILRSVGDRTTRVPDRSQGLMAWSLREQVRFLAAMDDGRVVSKATSRYLLAQMRPIKSHRWGLGTIGASAYKGGWLRANTVTRQMGIVDGYAVAILTDAVGPAVRQSDGDSAHVRQLNRLARSLDKRLASESDRR